MKTFKANSTIYPKLQEYIGTGKWRTRWNVQQVTRDNVNLYEYDEVESNYKLSIDEIKQLILESINKDTDNKILSGFTWNGMQVWLSTENQFNYKTAYDYAIQGGIGSLPITFKFGTVDTPIYYQFLTIEDLQDFYSSVINYIQNTLSEGWIKKDSYDFSVYEQL